MRTGVSTNRPRRKATHCQLPLVTFPRRKRHLATTMKSTLNENIIETFLDRITCFDPKKFLQREVYGGNKRIFHATSSVERRSRRAKKSRAKPPPAKKKSRRKGEDINIVPFNPRPVPTATLSDASPCSLDHQTAQGTRKVSDCSDDEILNSMIDIEEIEQHRPNQRRPPAIAPVVPPPPRTVKALFVGQNPRPFGSPIAQKPRKPAVNYHHQSSWKGKTVNASRCVGPF